MQPRFTANMSPESQVPMFKSIRFQLLAGLLMLGLGGCGDMATLPESAGVGARPTLPPPHPTLIPTVNIAPAKGWPPGRRRWRAGLAVSA